MDTYLQTTKDISACAFLCLLCYYPQYPQLECECQSFFSTRGHEVSVNYRNFITETYYNVTYPSTGQNSLYLLQVPPKQDSEHRISAYLHSTLIPGDHVFSYVSCISIFLCPRVQIHYATIVFSTPARVAGCPTRKLSNTRGPRRTCCFQIQTQAGTTDR